MASSIQCLQDIDHNTAVERPENLKDEARDSNTSNNSSNPKTVCLDPEDFQCCICFRLLIDPIIGKCGHDFCRLCLESWIENSPSTRPTCPLCRQVLAPTKKSALGPCVRLKAMIEKYFPKLVAKRKDELSRSPAHASPRRASSSSSFRNSRTSNQSDSISNNTGTTVPDSQLDRTPPRRSLSASNARTASQLDPPPVQQTPAQYLQSMVTYTMDQIRQLPARGPSTPFHERATVRAERAAAAFAAASMPDPALHASHSMLAQHAAPTAIHPVPIVSHGLMGLPPDGLALATATTTLPPSQQRTQVWVAAHCPPVHCGAHLPPPPHSMHHILPAQTTMPAVVPLYPCWPATGATDASYSGLYPWLHVADPAPIPARMSMSSLVPDVGLLSSSAHISGMPACGTSHAIAREEAHHIGYQHDMGQAHALLAMHASLTEPPTDYSVPNMAPFIPSSSQLPTTTTPLHITQHAAPPASLDRPPHAHTRPSHLARSHHNSLKHIGSHHAVRAAGPHRPHARDSSYVATPSTDVPQVPCHPASTHHAHSRHGRTTEAHLRRDSSAHSPELHRYSRATRSNSLPGRRSIDAPTASPAYPPATANALQTPADVLRSMVSHTMEQVRQQLLPEYPPGDIMHLHPMSRSSSFGTFRASVPQIADDGQLLAAMHASQSSTSSEPSPSLLQARLSKFGPTDPGSFLWLSMVLGSASHNSDELDVNGGVVPGSSNRHASDVELTAWNAASLLAKTAWDDGPMLGRTCHQQPDQQRPRQ